MQIEYPYSDTIAGYVQSFDSARMIAVVRTAAGRDVPVTITPSTYAKITVNLGESYRDATSMVPSLLANLDQCVFAYGTFYPKGSEATFEAQFLIFPGTSPGRFRHEEPAWWIEQARSIATSYVGWQFDHPAIPIDYRNYRTYLQLGGTKKGDFLQETDTISRLVYGMSAAYMLTGEDAFLDASEIGTRYLRDHMRFVDDDNDVTYWYHGIRVEGDRETKLLTSEFGDDLQSLPMYEQIYALAGPTMTYRLTGDPEILHDIEQTVKLFEKFFRDESGGGYFSHIDPITLDPRAASLGNNRARKNWNSVGDHAPAYLINLFLATGEARYAEFLEETFDTIVRYFPDEANSPFVNERFHEDWSHDQSWGWQQNRAVVGHNLKIAWNLLRMQSLKTKPEYVATARKLGDTMPAAGSDLQRFGWYDVVERTPAPGTNTYRFVWHDRKAWWQQEQAILAYAILHGTQGDERYLRLGREAAAFYNAFFLDHDDGAVYFNVLANGMPYLLGNERFKGSHSMSAYHSIELCFLSAVYTNLLITRQPMVFHFKPYPGGFPDNILRVAPDLLPPGSIRIDAAWLDDEPYAAFDADALTVTLPADGVRHRVKVKIAPTTWLQDTPA